MPRSYRRRRRGGPGRRCRSELTRPLGQSSKRNRDVIPWSIGSIRPSCQIVPPAERNRGETESAEEMAMMKLYSYYGSQATFRVRIALNIKGLKREDAFLHLEKGDQFAADYMALNPQAVVPTLFDDGHKLFQSMA